MNVEIVNGKARPISENEMLKRNALRMADHHREHCDGATCNIMLYALERLLERAGITLSVEEKRRFM